MGVHVYHFSRSRETGLIVYRDESGAMIQKTFPASWTDAEIMLLIGKELPQTATAGEPGKKDLPEAGRKSADAAAGEAEAGSRKRVSQDKEDKRVLRAKYLAELKERGFDLSGERSFSKIETAYFNMVQG